MSWKQTKSFNFSDVIYTTSKSELKIMIWLNRNTKVLHSISPQKWEVNACSIWSGYSVFRFVSATSLNGVPTIRGKRIMDRTWSHASITWHVWTVTHSLLFSRKRMCTSCKFVLVVRSTTSFSQPFKQALIGETMYVSFT